MCLSAVLTLAFYCIARIGIVARAPGTPQPITELIEALKGYQQERTKGQRGSEFVRVADHVLRPTLTGRKVSVNRVMSTLGPWDAGSASASSALIMYLYDGEVPKQGTLFIWFDAKGNVVQYGSNATSTVPAQEWMQNVSWNIATQSWMSCSSLNLPVEPEQRGGN
jgi:hypothetical protein